MGKINRIFSIIMAVVMLFCITPISVSARNATFDVNGLRYLIISSNTVALAGYTSNPVNITIPQTVMSNNVNYTVTQVWGWAFQNCTTLRDVNLPLTITSIGESAFQGSGLTNINLPSNLTSIGASAFRDTKITSITVPGSVKDISDFAFAYCQSLRYVTLLSGVQSIGLGSFVHNPLLESVIIPSSVISIANPSVTWLAPAFFLLYSPNLTIYGVTGSRAQTFANARNIPFRPI